MNNPYPSETGCCSRFNPEPWQDKELVWEGKLFLKDHVRCVFHIPLKFGKVITRDMERIALAGALPLQPPLMLSEHTSPWGTDLYIEVTKEVPNAEHVRLSGSFLTKVFEGPYRNTRLWCQQMAQWVASRGKSIHRQFNYYTTCPKCAQHYGKNYVVLLAQV